MPIFYQEVFVSFNKCKKEMPCDQISSDNFLQQPLWNNRYICYKGKSLCYITWIKSGVLYVKDMFDENGNFRTLEYMSTILTCKANWYVNIILCLTFLENLCENLIFQMPNTLI